MANKLDNAVVAIIAALQGDLVKADGTGVLKSVERRVVIPGEANVPAAGVVMARFHREDTTWIGEVLVTLVTNKGGLGLDTSVTEICAEIDASIETLVNNGTAGVVIDQPMFDPWYHATNANSPLCHVGATGSLRIRGESPLKI